MDDLLSWCEFGWEDKTGIDDATQLFTLKLRFTPWDR